ncbi:ABC transporter substrate-binding protein [Paracoccus kondratievae]|uniref:iron-siderophore ABC transporter substrate-binding protein n=1 Tax=Paracoccus kondratievae TaxID=135740 RepID=UPI0012663DCE|nr:iron-siderophore ABC transporter substrate-binding protein [Paracoccus kondratievae]QFQ88784.1 ABC transporter substrate-binding protein [Paracoccus kondratievae]
MRLAAVDWAMLETAIAIGHSPVAVCELLAYRDESAVGDLPGVVDLGLRGAPNYELLQLTRPDLILSSPFYMQHEARLARVAPVLSLGIYTPGEPPLVKAMRALADLGRATGGLEAAARAQAGAETALDALALRLRPYADRPVSVVEIGDARHLRAFGFDSMFGNVLVRLGLRNALGGKTQFSFRAPLPLERLADAPESRLVVTGDLPTEAMGPLRRSVLWRALPQVAEGRVYRLPRVNAFGGLPSGLRFAGELVQAFEAGPITL